MRCWVRCGEWQERAVFQWWAENDRVQKTVISSPTPPPSMLVSPFFEYCAAPRFCFASKFFFNRPFFFALVCSPVFCPASAVLGPVHNRNGGGGEGDHEFNILIPPAKMMQVKWYFYSALVPCCGIDTCLQRRNLHHL